MEEQIAEWVAKLSVVFWHTNHNPKLRKLIIQSKTVNDVYDEFEKMEKSNIDFSNEEMDYYLKFLFLYQGPLFVEPKLFEIFEMIPWSYHRRIVDRFTNPLEALAFIVQIIKNDWGEEEMIAQLNKGLN